MKAPDGYILKDELKHDDLVTFIKPWLEKWNAFTLIFKGSSLLLFLMIGYFGGQLIASGHFSSSVIIHLVAGAVLSFLLIPIHELLHGLAYKLTGAPKVTYKAEWKQFAFYAAADKYITNYQNFRFVALTPFIVITALLLTAFFTTPGEWNIFLFGMLTMHTTACIGDFALLSYMFEHRKQDVLTVDDLANDRTLFYINESD